MGTWRLSSDVRLAGSHSFERVFPPTAGIPKKAEAFRRIDASGGEAVADGQPSMTLENTRATEHVLT
jgi:hypothetical protein